MRWVIALVLVGCASRASGPAWPKAHDREADGGESLAPHARTQVAAQLEDDPIPAPPPVEVPLAPVAASQPPAPDPTVTDDGQVQVQMTEEVIEIKEGEDSP